MPVLTSFMGGFEVKKSIDLLMRKGIPNFDIAEEAVYTLKVLMDHNDWISKKTDPIIEFDVNEKKVKEIFDICRNDERLELGEIESREILPRKPFEKSLSFKPSLQYC